MLKISIVGYGKMGKAIKQIASKGAYKLETIVRSHDELKSSIQALKNSDIILEFTAPESATQNLQFLADNGLKVVSGTTGWLDHKENIESSFIENNGAFLYASNFSLGMNMMFILTQKLANMTNNHQEFQAEITEIHHTEKKDAPSGTAISLANLLVEERGDYDGWNLGEQNKQRVSISAMREEGVKGLHELNFRSENEIISLRHEANSREVFAVGALAAANFLNGKRGIFNMRDVLGL